MTLACHASNAGSIPAGTVAHLVTVMNVISVSRIRDLAYRVKPEGVVQLRTM